MAAFDEILGAATELFAEKGFRGTSMRDIATALGMHAGSLYVHIRDKGELLERIVGRISDMHGEDMSELLAAELPTGEKLRLAAERLLSGLAANPAATRVYFHEWRHLDDERQAQIINARDDYEAGIRAILQEGIDAGELRPDLDPKLAGAALLGMVNWTYEWFSKGGELDPEDVADAFVKMVLEGLIPR